MTSAPHLLVHSPPRRPSRPGAPQRLRLRPKTLTTGYVDGAWWPRSRDLVAELPALVAVLAVRLGDVLRVAYNLSEWNSAPRRAGVDSRQVRLDGFNTRPAHTVDLISTDHHRLTLLVVPSDTNPASAHRTMALAVDRDNVQTVGDLFTAGREADGGRIPEQTSRSTS